MDTCPQCDGPARRLVVTETDMPTGKPKLGLVTWDCLTCGDVVAAPRESTPLLGPDWTDPRDMWARDHSRPTAV